MTIRQFQYKIQDSIDNGTKDSTELWWFMLKTYLKVVVRGIFTFAFECIGTALVFFGIMCVCYIVANAIHEMSGCCDSEKCSWEFCHRNIGK